MFYDQHGKQERIATAKRALAEREFPSDGYTVATNAGAAGRVMTINPHREPFSDAQHRKHAVSSIRDPLFRPVANLPYLLQEKRPRSAPMRGLGRVLLVLAIAIELPWVGVPLLYCVGLTSALLLVPSLLMRPSYRPLIILALVATIGTVFSASIHGVPLSTVLSASSARIIVYASAIALFIRAFDLRSRDLIISTAIGITGLWIQVDPTRNFAASWKYALFVPISLLVLSMFPTRLRGARRLGYGAIVALAAISALSALRSGAVEMVLVGAVAFVHGLKLVSVRFKASAIILATCAFALIAVFALPTLGEGGAFGASVQESFREDSTSGAGAILGGRPEFPIAVATALESPFFGHGQMPVVTTGVLTVAGDIAESFGVSPNSSVLRTWYSPSTYVTSAHSIIMEMWIVSGIAGLALGLYCAFVMTRALTRDLSNGTAVSLGWIFLGIALLWDLIFSPMLSGRDILLSLGLMIALSTEIQPQKDLRRCSLAASQSLQFRTRVT